MTVGGGVEGGRGGVGGGRKREGRRGGGGRKERVGGEGEGGGIMIGASQLFMLTFNFIDIPQY